MNKKLIQFFASQVVGLPVLKVAQPIQWQDGWLIVCPTAKRYWGVKPVGQYTLNGWRGYVVIWGSGLHRVAVLRDK